MGCHSKFARCSAVVVEVFPKIMQEILAATPISKASLYSILGINQTFREQLSCSEVLTARTLMTDGCSKLDFTLIYKVFTFFKFIEPPTQRWGANPLENEIKIGDDVERMRLTRNHFLHTFDCDMTHSEFQTFFTDFVNLGMRVDIYLGKSKDSGFQKEIENYKTIQIDDGMENCFIDSLKREKEKQNSSNAKFVKEGDASSKEELEAELKKAPADREYNVYSYFHLPVENKQSEATVQPNINTRNVDRKAEFDQMQQPRYANFISEFTNESTHLTVVLKACGIQLHLVKLQQSWGGYFEEIKEFIYSLGKQPKGSPQIRLVGSRSEGLQMDMMFDRVMRKLPESDTDSLIVVQSIIVFDHINDKDYLDEGYPSSSLVLRLPDKQFPGYVKLAVSKMCESIKDCCHIENPHVFLKNTVKEKMFETEEFRQVFPAPLHVHGPAVNTSKFEPLKNAPEIFLHCEFVRKRSGTSLDGDYTFCLRGEIWPVEASEWETRRRDFNWPTKQLVDNVIKSGYFLAGVGSKESDTREIQWRVSFNTAEQLLIESFNETQIHCTMILKLFKASKLSKVAGKNITSYVIKTVMFWCLEKTPNDYWQPSNLVCCIAYCLSQLVFFVKTEFLPNYFIRERNQFIFSEFTPIAQTKTIQCIEHFLKDPTASIISLLSTNNMYPHDQDTLHLKTISHEIFIREWLQMRLSMAETYHGSGIRIFCKLYEGYNIQDIFLRCKCVLKKITTLNYRQPFAKILQNCMGVLQYILLKREENTPNSESYSNYSKYMQLSVGADCTHTNLRIATCLLDEGATEKCLHYIRMVTNNKKQTYQSLTTYSILVRQAFHAVLHNFATLPHRDKIQVIKKYRRVIDNDLIHQDPYKTLQEFKEMKEEGNEVGGYMLFELLWERVCFEVTFMAAEEPILPKPVSLELCADRCVIKVSFNPILYGYLLEFIWHVKNHSTTEQREDVLEKMRHCLSSIPEEQQSRALNFLTYCCSLQNEYRSAYRYLIESFYLNPIEQNVAYLYIKYIIKLMQTISSDLNDNVSLSREDEVIYSRTAWSM